MIISKTPVRVSLFGGGSDYKSYCNDHQGMTISTTINKYCYIHVRHLPPFFEHKYRVVYSVIENVTTIDKIQHPSARECMRFMDIKDGVEIHHDGDLPARSGLGTSSSFTVGLLHALHMLENNPISKYDLAMEAIHVEQEMIKESVGSQDQMACAIGGLNLFKFSDKKPEVTPLKLSKERIKEIESCMLLVFTGFPHMATEVAKSYNFCDHEKELNEMVGITRQAYDVLLNGCVMEIGKLLNESWNLKKKLSNKITTPYINYIYETALKSGATGGKLLGAGGSGFMLIFAEPDAHKTIKQNLDGLLFVPFEFEQKGSEIIVNNGT